MNTNIRSLVLATLLTALLFAPLTTLAMEAIGSIDFSSLTAPAGKPTLSGMAFGTKTLRLEIKKEGSSKVVYKSKVLKVKDDRWKVRVTKKLATGSYEVTLRDSKKKILTTQILVIGGSGNSATLKNTTFNVRTVPLLWGGTARTGSAVPVAYLQVTNMGKERASLRGFWVKQNGTASARALIGLTTVDDQGGSQGAVGGVEGATPFINGMALAPTSATLEPGQTKLFTVKAVLTNNVFSYVGQSLMIDVTGVEADAKIDGAFPLRGTTWTILP